MIIEKTVVENNRYSVDLNDYVAEGELTVTIKDSGWSTHTRIKMPTDGIIAWMPLPEPYMEEE